MATRIAGSRKKPTPATNPTRDLSLRQLNKALQKHGFSYTGFAGYWNLPEPFQNTSVSRYNAGLNRRRQLAYMLAEFDRRSAK